MDGFGNSAGYPVYMVNLDAKTSRVSEVITKKLGLKSE
jgi:hypothetical protein